MEIHNLFGREPFKDKALDFSLDHIPETLREAFEFHIHMTRTWKINNVPYEQVYPFEIYERIAKDETIIPKFLKELNTETHAGIFFSALYATASTWSNSDKTPSHIVNKELDKIVANLKAIKFSLKSSTDLEIFFNKNFNNVIHENNAIPAYVTTSCSFIFEKLAEKIEKMNREEFFETRSSANLPKKINQNSAFRTLLIRNIKQAMVDIFDNPRHQLVRDIVAVAINEPYLEVDTIIKTKN